MISWNEVLHQSAVASALKSKILSFLNRNLKKEILKKKKAFLIVTSPSTEADSMDGSLYQVEATMSETRHNVVTGGAVSGYPTQHVW